MKNKNTSTFEDFWSVAMGLAILVFAIAVALHC